MLARASQAASGRSGARRDPQEGPTSRDRLARERVAAISRATASEEIALMPEYEAYVLGPDGHITWRYDIVCDDEGAARERAKTLVDDHDIELWEGSRRIETFPHKGVGGRRRFWRRRGPPHR